MDKNKKNSAAEKTGSALAHIQSFVDDIFQAGFKGLKNISAEKPKKAPSDHSTSEKVFDGLRKTAGFLGQAGEAYYQKYEELKAKRAQKKK